MFGITVIGISSILFFAGEININGGAQWRPNIHVEDVANAIIKIIESPLEKIENQVFNLCNNSQNFL